MGHNVLKQTQKTELLEQAVVNKSPDEVRELLKELGTVDMTARALGIACRYVGLDMVKALAEGGAKFSFPATEDIEKTYHCYADVKFQGWLTNYALMLLDIFRGDLSGVSSIKGLGLFKKTPREQGKPLPILPVKERIGILRFLCENKETLRFNAEEFIFIAYFVKSYKMISVLKEMGIELSEAHKAELTQNTGKSNAWYEYCHLTSLLNAEDFVEVLGNILKDTGGEKFSCTDLFFEKNAKKMFDPKVFEFLLDNFNQSKMKKTQMMKEIISGEHIGCLPALEKHGWMKLPKKRDELIEFATSSGSTEAAAWLLDFKNRTADFAAEQEKAEKKMMRELNADPNSVTELKKIWSYKKLEDGTLIITNYKGLKTEVVIPDKIGKSEVTAIGKGAFAGRSGVCAGQVTTYATPEQQKTHSKITKLVLPSGLKSIGLGAFAEMLALESIEIPESVTEIDKFAFYECISLKSVTVPGGVKSIGDYCFSNCNNLKNVKICDGVEEIKGCAFSNCDNLEHVEIPASVKKIESIKLLFHNAPLEAFDTWAPHLVIYAEKGSAAEKYCREKGFRVAFRAGATVQI